MENRDWKNNQLHRIQKQFNSYTCQESAKGRWTVKISVFCGLQKWWIQSIHIFSQTLYLFCTVVQPADHMYWASRFPSPLTAFYRPRLPTTVPLPLSRTLRLDLGQNYKTLMTVFSNSVHFTVKPSSHQESDLTWRPWAHSHRFHTTGTGQVAAVSLSAIVDLFTFYLNVKRGLSGSRCPSDGCIGKLSGALM